MIRDKTNTLPTCKKACKVYIKKCAKRSLCISCFEIVHQSYADRAKQCCDLVQITNTNFDKKNWL